MKEYTTRYGQVVSLYSIVMKDYNGDEVINGADIGWIGSNTDYMVQNMSAVGGVKPKRLYQGLQFMLNKRYSNRWQLMASAVFSWSDGFAMRPVRQDFNFDGPMVMDTTFLAGLNQTVNNMEGPLPQTQNSSSSCLALTGFLYWRLTWAGESDTTQAGHSGRWKLIQ